MSGPVVALSELLITILANITLHVDSYIMNEAFSLLAVLI
jgi:hypothetical protein